jgi:hypothetical protein
MHPRKAREYAHIALEINGKLAAAHFDEAGMRRIKQLGVNHVIMGGPEIPWEESQIRALMDRLKSGGLTLGNMMISGFTNTFMAGRDATRKFKRFSSPSGRRPRQESRWWNTTSMPIAWSRATTRKPAGRARA